MPTDKSIRPLGVSPQPSIKTEPEIETAGAAVFTTPKTTAGIKSFEGQCWECQRRHWACDSTRPVCKRCKDAGIVCPGFDDRKPLTWLPPGRVSSRSRKSRQPTTSKVTKIKSCPSTPSAAILRRRVGSIVSSRSDPGRGSSCSDDEASIDPAMKRTLACLVLVPGLRGEMADIIDAARYYNQRLWPKLFANRLAPNMYTAPIVGVDRIPLSTRYSLVAAYMGHRLLNLPASDSPYLDPDNPMQLTSPASSLQLQLYQNFGNAVRALNSEIELESARKNDAMVGSIYSLLVTEIFHSTRPNWRPHMDGIIALVHFRGGANKMFETSAAAPTLITTMTAFGLINTLANATSPANDQCSADLQFHLLEPLTQLQKLGSHPRMTSPPQLTSSLMRVNYYRWQLNTRPQGSLGNLQNKIVSALDEILAFEPGPWAEDKWLQTRHHWLLLGKVYKCATFLYAVNTLAGLLERRPPSNVVAGYRAELFTLLNEGMQSEVTKPCLLWPLAVAGFEAAFGNAAERAFVAVQLMNLSPQCGAPTLVARILFEKFWSSDKTDWDDCFNEPYCLCC